MGQINVEINGWNIFCQKNLTNWRDKFDFIMLSGSFVTPAIIPEYCLHKRTIQLPSPLCIQLHNFSAEESSAPNRSS